MELEFEPVIILWTALFTIVIWGSIAMANKFTSGYGIPVTIALIIFAPILSYFILLKMTR